MPVKRRGLARTRRVAGYSQEALAERLSVDRTTVARWEAGENSPQPWQRPRIAEAFGISLSELDQLLQRAGNGSPSAAKPAEDVPPGGDEQLPAIPPEQTHAGAPNELLRKARERTASLTSADECVSRQELAELVNAWIWKHHHKRVETSASYIGQLERGTIRWPGKLYRQALRAILKAPSDAALGFVNTRRAVVKLEDVNRKQFIQRATGLGVGALVLEGPLAQLLELLQIREPTAVPRRIGATDIEQVRTASQVFSGWDFTYGGELVREAVMGQLRWSAGLLTARCPERLQPELHSAVGDLAETAGYIAFDVGAHGDARRVYRFGLACAEKADDWHLRAAVLSSMTAQAIRTGQPDEGLTLAEQGLVRADRLSATERAMLHTDRARALATMRRGNEALAAIGTADDHFAHSTPDNDRPFMAYYGATYHATKTGHALFDLAIFGQNVAQATERLTAAAAGHTGYHARSRAICLTKLASLTMATGDPIQAVLIGMDALEAASTVRSHRVTNDLHELARFAAAHQHLDEVTHLRHRISTLAPPGNP